MSLVFNSVSVSIHKRESVTWCLLMQRVSFQWSNNPGLFYCEETSYVKIRFFRRNVDLVICITKELFALPGILPQCYLSKLPLCIKNIKPFSKMCFRHSSPGNTCIIQKNVFICCSIRQWQPYHLILFNYQCQESSIKVSIFWFSLKIVFRGQWGLYIGF